MMVMNCFGLYHIDSIFISVTISFLLPTSRHTHTEFSLPLFFLSFFPSNPRRALIRFRFRFAHVQTPQDLSNKEVKVVVATAGRVR